VTATCSSPPTTTLFTPSGFRWSTESKPEGQACEQSQPA
jgi:hypothetical protein